MPGHACKALLDQLSSQLIENAQITTHSSGRSHNSVCAFTGAILRSKRSRDARGAGPGAATTASDDSSLGCRGTYWDDLACAAALELLSEAEEGRMGIGIRDECRPGSEPPSSELCIVGNSIVPTRRSLRWGVSPGTRLISESGRTLGGSFGGSLDFVDTERVVDDPSTPRTSLMLLSGRIVATDDVETSR
jgi:hypothetical protein